LLPDVLRPWVMDIAERMQIPPDYTAAAAIVALGALIGRKLGIYPKRHDDWLVVPNLWGGVVGRPAMLKTPAIAEALKPLNRLVAEAIAAHEVGNRLFEAMLEEFEARKTARKQQMVAAAKQGKPLDMAPVPEPTPPPLRAGVARYATTPSTALAVAP
jgi:hypothetical protein